MADFTGRRMKMYDHEKGAGDDAYSDEPKVVEWTEVNRQLRKAGFQSVRMLSSQDVPLSSGRYMCLDPDSNKTLQHTLMTLLTDFEHRTVLVDNLMDSNKRLKAEIAVLTEKTDLDKTSIKDLKIMLECSRKRVTELERERDQSSVYRQEDGERGRNLRNAIHKRCMHLEEAFREKELELDLLSKRLRIMNDEEEKRVKRQNKVFQEFKKRTARAHSLTDGKLLDIIDMYESQLHDLKQELHAARTGDGVFTEQESSSTSLRGMQPMKNAKHIIKGLERRLQDADKRAQALENEKELLALEMGDSIPGEKNAKDPFRSKRKFSTCLEDLDNLPVDICQQYLKELCSELGVEDVEQVLPEIRKLSKKLEVSGQYQEYCYDLHQLVARLKGSSRSSNSGAGDTMLSKENMRQTLQTVEQWRHDLAHLKDLQKALNRLLEHVMPWAKIHFTLSTPMKEMASIIHRLADDETTALTKEGYEHISRSTLEGIVKHFQNLFDVSASSGILTAMTDVYRKLGEAQNVQKTLRNLLGLSDICNSAAVVDAVGRLCQAHNSTTSRQLQTLFETDNLASVIKRVKEYNEFFPAFKETMCKLMSILAVERMDQVIPAVRALKLLTS